ncbi:anti-sigma factor domain-containing protein [Alkalihalobacillus sp. AL-G]|uniref:anti-sigma factor domain-containing protein n=1 Tax=Alkalihalobacillus sp. AL-G TaxID=2926399 RepID=UPI00272D6FA7|nr:anti-sigma factor domain-containing protein [Alkalihalobacillus sp. AL-G]WLD92724.1 anti-sigma factor domain-containing protein [Alkalihalobacillus sp. AL-G]
MKRGVVMNVTKHKAIILTKDGSFVRVRLKNGKQPTIGQEYIYPMEPKYSYMPMKRMVLPAFSLALSILIIFVLVAGAFPFGQNKASAAAYVSFDINPSIEVAVDDDMNIVKVRALNEDAEKLLSSSDGFQDTSLLYFSQSLFEMLDKNGYLDTYHDLLITTSLNDESLQSEVKQLLEESVNEIREDPRLVDMSVAVFTTTSSTRDEANKHGVSMGKYLVYQDALKNGRTLTLEKASELSYTELKNIAAIKLNDDSDKVESTMELTVPIQQVSRTHNDRDGDDLVNPDDSDQSSTSSEQPKTKIVEKDKPDAGVTEKGIQTLPKKNENAKKENSENAKEENPKTSMNQSVDKDDRNVKDQLLTLLEFHLHKGHGEHIPPGQLKKLERLQLDFIHGNRDDDKQHRWKHEHPSNTH